MLVAGRRPDDAREGCVERWVGQVFRREGVTMAQHKDDPETMAQMRAWLAQVAQSLDLDDSLPGRAEQPVLDLIAEVAHGPSRPGAPLTAFLLGVAVGRGDDLNTRADALNTLAADYRA
jgi:hypothetical protein